MKRKYNVVVRCQDKNHREDTGGKSGRVVHRGRWKMKKKYKRRVKGSLDGNCLGAEFVGVCDDPPIIQMILNTHI